MGNNLMQTDLSVWGMYQHADIVVKCVMIGLILASVVTWAIFFSKSVEFFNQKRRLKREQQLLAEARSLNQANDIAADFGSKSLSLHLLNEAQNELELSEGSDDNEGIKERTSFRLERRVAAVGRQMGRGNGYLATIGAISPFVGLFGTVWGIMNSFIGIAQTQTTNLAVVAPGIAEALLATAIGLVAGFDYFPLPFCRFQVQGHFVILLTEGLQLAGKQAAHIRKTRHPFQHHRIDLRLNKGVTARPAKFIGHWLNISKTAAFRGEKTHRVPRRSVRQNIIDQADRLHGAQRLVINTNRTRVVDQLIEFLHHQHVNAHLAEIGQHPAKGSEVSFQDYSVASFTIAYMLNGVVNFRHREQFGCRRNLAAGGKAHQLSQLIRRAGSRTRDAAVARN